MLYVRQLIRQILLEKQTRGQKTKRTLYHINKRPATPQPKVTYWEQWDPKATDRDTGEKTGDFVKVPDTDIWKRHWLDNPVKSGVFLTPNPLDIAMNHGRSGHVYAYKVPEWVIDKSGGMHRYDTGSEVLIPEDVWNEAGKEIEFLGKSMDKEELWDKMMPTSYGPGHHRPATKPSWMSDEEMEKWQAGQMKFNLSGLRATKHPEDVIKLLKPEEREKAVAAIEAKKEDIPGFIEKGPRDKKGIVVPPFGQRLDKKDEELLALLKKHMAESLLREYVHQLLTEAANSPADLPGNTAVTIFEDGNSTRITYARPTKKQGSEWTGYAMSQRPPKGIIEIFRPGSIEDDGPCGGAWQVGHSAASPGWGPLLYDVAMEWATLNGGGLISDREIVSVEARNVWNYYMANRGDVTGIQMDDLKNSLTPEDEDNCNQQAAGSTSVAAFGAENAEKQGWVDSPLSKRWTKPPTTMTALKKLGRLVEL